VRENDELLTSEILADAQKSLLEVTKQSKSIYVMGYCTPEAFVAQPYGFDTTLGAMENATKACWHVFKKGRCRHGCNCAKQHPIFEMPLQVVVEMA